MEDEAFPDFLTGPPGAADMAATQWADAGDPPERRLDRQDKPVEEEGSSVSTSDCTSSSSASMPEATGQSAAGNVSDALPIRAPSKTPKTPFHRVPYLCAANSSWSFLSSLMFPLLCHDSVPFFFPRETTAALLLMRDNAAGY